MNPDETLMKPEPPPPLRLGVYAGVAGDAGAAERVEGSDALLCLGCVRADTTFGCAPRERPRAIARVFFNNGD